MVDSCKAKRGFLPHSMHASSQAKPGATAWCRTCRTNSGSIGWGGLTGRRRRCGSEGRPRCPVVPRPFVRRYAVGTVASIAPSGLGNHPSSDRVHRHGLGMDAGVHFGHVGGQGKGAKRLLRPECPRAPLVLGTLRWSPHMPSKRMGRKNPCSSGLPTGNGGLEWSRRAGAQLRDRLPTGRQEASGSMDGMGVPPDWLLDPQCGAFRSDINRKGMYVAPCRMGV